MAGPNSSDADPLGLVPQLVALASDQADTRVRVSDLTETVGDLVDRVTELATGSDQLGGQLDAVRSAIEELTSSVARLSRESDRTPLWSWVDMDADTQRGALRELGEWVDEVLIGRYRIDDRRLPRCWYRHSDAVEELSWLYLDRQRVYRDGATAGAGEWHDRWLPGALNRIGKSLAGCARGEHRTPSDLSVTDTGFDAYLTTLDQSASPAGDDRADPHRQPPSPAGPWPGQQAPPGPSWPPDTPAGPPSPGQPWRSG